MKITPVQAYKTNPQAFISQHKAQQSNVMPQHPINSQKPALTLVDTNYNQLLINKKTTNFTGINKTSLQLVKQIPLEDRLASMFEVFRRGDLIMTGKNLQEAKKAISNSIDMITHVIKRAYFIEDDNISGTLGFVKNFADDIEVINPNKFDIDILSNGKKETLKSEDIAYVLPNDILQFGETLLPIKDKPKTNLSAFRKNFARAFDFTQEVTPEIEKINKKNISSLGVEVRKKANPVTFKDVGGQDKLIDELKKSIIYPMKYPKGFENIDVNHGFILYGPPGTGKTHIARALANEANANFFGLNGLELESKWVGESESNWRNLFESAKENQPSIIFIDEFDAVARSRENSSNEYGNKVVDQILTLMSDIDNEGSEVYVIAATNNFKSLDSAITRSGRFGKHLEVGLPNLDGLKKIFDIHAKNKPLDPKVNKDEIAKRLFDLKASGADVKYIVNEAHSLGYTRAGIFEKMENNTLKDSDIDNFTILPEDIDKAIKAFSDSKQANTRKPIGYTK